MSKYAADTSVTTHASRAEIERTLERYGADTFAYQSEEGRAMIAFRIKERRVRFALTLPDKRAKEFTHHSRGMRTAEAAVKAWEQASRQRWRALALVIKAKLEAVEAGITTIEDEFLAHTLLPDGSTVGQRIQQQIAISYRDNTMPHLLAAPPTGGEP